MPKIIFNAKLVKLDNKDVVELSASEGHKNVSTFFTPPTSPAELVIDLTASLNSLIVALELKEKEEDRNYKRYGQFI